MASGLIVMRGQIRRVSLGPLRRRIASLGF